MVHEYSSPSSLPLFPQDEEITCFRDIKPGAPHHYLVVPTKHVGNCKSLGKEHIPMGRTYSIYRISGLDLVYIPTGLWLCLPAGICRCLCISLVPTLTRVSSGLDISKSVYLLKQYKHIVLKCTFWSEQDNVSLENQPGFAPSTDIAQRTPP